MKKKLFQNYEFELDKNEKKVLSNFAKQALKQFEVNDKSIREARIFSSIIAKLNSSEEKVKFTKEEKTNLTYQLNNNLTHLKKKADNAWLITKWFYRNMVNQYQNILATLND